MITPLLALFFIIGLLSVPFIHSAATSTTAIPLFNPSKYTAQELDTSTLNEGIPDVWKTSYGLSVIDSTVANADYNGSGIMNLEKYRLNLHPFAKADTLPQSAKQKVDPSKAAAAKQAVVHFASVAPPEIAKGGFSGSYQLLGRIAINLYGFKLSASWGYVKDGKIGETVDGKFNGWVSANGGGEIEVWSVEVAGVKKQFVELDASKKSHGIKQEVQNAAAGAFLLTWNHMGRSDQKAVNNAYFAKVYLTDGQNEITPSLVKTIYPLKGKSISKTQFEPQALAFTVKSEDLNPKDKPPRKLWICFDCPESSLNTYGTFIDDVRLTPIEFVTKGENGGMAPIDFAANGTAAPVIDAHVTGCSISTNGVVTVGVSGTVADATSDLIDAPGKQLQTLKVESPGGTQTINLPNNGAGEELPWKPYKWGSSFSATVSFTVTGPGDYPVNITTDINAGGMAASTTAYVTVSQSTAHIELNPNSEVKKGIVWR